jgi:DNA-binding NtrC family response regulator
MHAGLGDLLPWPFDERDFVAMLANAREASTIDPAGLPAGRAEALFAHSPLMRQVLEAVRAAAATRQGVLICGEEGTGRELVARTIHQTAGGSPDTFVRVDCAQVSGQGVEEALFGPRHLHDQDRPAAGVDCLSPEAAISRARGGTLFLVHLAELPARIQIRLSKLLRDREAAVGGGEPVEIDVRPIGAMEPDVDAAVADGRVRRDLIDRLSGARIDVPPLRDRRADIPLLAVSFARRLCGRDGIPPKRFSRSALALLSALPWHGNARELRELILGVLRSIRRPVIQLDDVLEHARLDGASARIQPGVTLRDARARFERECISAVLIRHHGRVGEAAKALGIQRTNLYRKVRQLNVARSLLSTRR